LRGGSADSHFQSMVPPSLHPNGEQVMWEKEGEPTAYLYDTLHARGAWYAGVTIVARHWPAQGSRNTATMALAGGLVRAGWLDSEIDEFTQVAAKLTHDEEWAQRKNAAAARDKIDAGLPVTGLPRLAETLRNGDAVVETLCAWLGLETSQFGSGLPRIVVSGKPLRDVEEASRSALELRMVSLPDAQRLYTQEGTLVWVREKNNNGCATVRVEPITPATLSLELSRSADYIGASRGRPSAQAAAKPRMSHVLPPERMVGALVRSREWQLAALRVVAGTPILHADGEVVTTPGYDPVTQALYCPPTPLTLPPLPDRPTLVQARDALAALAEPFAEFPFDGAESRANNLALLFTLLLRRTLNDLAPAAAVNAPEMGYGKSLLVQTHYALATGGDLAIAALPATEDEWGKQIMTWLREGREAILLDNVEEPLRSGQLEGALTSHTYSRRDLGVIANASAPNEAVWIMTGNNLVLRGALPRRVFTINMAGVAKPYDRASSTFKHPNLVAWVKAERPRLLAAAYTVYRYWVGLGRPPAPHGRELASFETWSRVVGGVLACVGVDAFLATAHEQMADTDPSRVEYAQFVATLGRTYPGIAFRVADLYRDHLAHASEYDAVYGMLPSELQALAGNPGKLRPLIPQFLERPNSSFRRQVPIAVKRGDGPYRAARSGSRGTHPVGRCAAGRSLRNSGRASAAWDERSVCAPDREPSALSRPAAGAPAPPPVCKRAGTAS
jgi:hypothetical protein